MSAELGENSQSLTLKSQGPGECLVLLFLDGHRETIYDIFMVRVATIVEPSPGGTGEPVRLHVGSTATFTLVNDQRDRFSSDDVNWASDNQKVLQIDSVSGKAKAIAEGLASISLSNKINAASAV